MIERGFNRDNPDPRIVPGPQFYRILFGDQDRIGIDIREWIAAERVVIRQRAGGGRQTRRTQRREKAFRRAYEHQGGDDAN